VSLLCFLLLLLLLLLLNIFVPCFIRSDQYFSGIRGSHWISGSAMIDYGSMTVMPLALRSAGSVCLSTNATIFQQPLHHDKEQEFGRPHYYRIKLPESGIVAEVLPTPTLTAATKQQ
jgi:hypothetical protein